MSPKRIPVFLLTGFLGSGKTTLLNAALKTPGLEHTAVVVNEIGEIGLDHLIVSQASDNVVLLDAGCLCCVNTGALHETMADLSWKRARGEVPPFERVIIETSGAADPAPLLNVLLGHPLVIEHYALEAVVCTVDAQHFLESRKEYPELDKQVAVAERLFVTKTDLADPSEVLSLLNTLNPGAEMVDSVPAAFSSFSKRHKPPTIFKPLQSRHTKFQAHSFRPRGQISWAGWAAWSKLVKAEFGEHLVRVKGLLQMAETNEIVFVQGVQGVFHKPERFREWPDDDHDNRLVCISRDLKKEEIEATLPALNTAPGTQATYSLKELQERQAQQ
jgi:G3E family GTPase